MRSGGCTRLEAALGLAHLHHTKVWAEQCEGQALSSWDSLQSQMGTDTRRNQHSLEINAVVSLRGQRRSIFQGRPRMGAVGR